MDFYQIKERSIKNGAVELYPDFKVCRSKYLMVRGRSFYAIWDEEKGLWSTDEYDVQRIVDAALIAHKEKTMQKNDGVVLVKLMSDFSSKSWAEFRNYVGHISDNAHELDVNLTFSNTDVKKQDYVSKRLPYPLAKGKCDAYEELISTLYDPEERSKLEWAIGSIVTGDSKSIQKFIVLYGDPGSGKGTFINVVQKLFQGYYTTFEAKALTAAGNAFATEVFKANPLVAIQHDGDLSKIEDNSKLNSIVSHEEMTMNEKYKPSYTSRINSFLFMGTNKPVRITDGKSGIIRRLIDVKPSGRKLSTKHYQALMNQIDFELGAIAHHCMEVYREMGKNYYSNYRPVDMMMQTDIFFNFIESYYHIFKEQDGITLAQAYEMYKQFCDEALVEFKSPRHKFREEMKNYFSKFSDVARVNGAQVRSYYSGFLIDKFKNLSLEKDEPPNPLVLDEIKSAFDEVCATCPAQYAANEKPIEKWDNVKTILSDINTGELHYVKVPLNHIVIDFDLKDSNGKKSLELNMEAASKWPSTYTEFSKSGSGIHLHYFYDGDVDKLSRVYAEGIEIKVFVGKASLRRKLTKCNNIPIATINSGLPLKGEKMINFDAVKSEKGLRDLIKRNLNKEIHPGTKPSIDFIHKILEDFYSSGMKYDVTDMRPAILAFANNSSNQSEYCIKLVSEMKFHSEEASDSTNNYNNDELVFYDVEVFPNLFVVVWKPAGKQKVKMINPTAADIEPLLSMKLVGYNCRRYDNHIIYAAYIGYTIEQLYKLSQKIINSSKNAMFGEAYNISYTDIYDFSSKKQSLKKWQIELGIHHQELGLPWDQPVPEHLWTKVADYCGNDVDSTEVVFYSPTIKQDFIARQILAELSGLSLNDSTQAHTARIMFGNDPRPQDKFNYVDLSGEFPGYKFENGKSTYRGEDPSEGGYVYAEPGMYTDVALLDVASMHPTTITHLNFFGPYTERYDSLVKSRLAIKNGRLEEVKHMLNGIFEKYITTQEAANDLAYALKIHALNIVYGLTAAKFDNKFRHPLNVDNIIAKRPALFMIDLRHAVQEKGFTVAHIKTDSIKIPNATPEIIEFVMEFGKKYGYTFEHEATYSKLCLVNDAVYIAKYKDGKHADEWTATGSQFAEPYVYKTLFSKEPIVFDDLCETKSVSTSLFLDMNEELSDVSVYEKVKEMRNNPNKKYSVADTNTLNAWANRLTDEELDARIAEGHDYHFVGKVGLFCPIQPGKGGGVLLREKDGNYYAANGSKGYRWMEAEMVKIVGKESDIDHTYFTDLVDDAVSKISKYGDFEWFVSDDTVLPCDAHKGIGDFVICKDCKHQEGEIQCKINRDVVPF